MEKVGNNHNICVLIDDDEDDQLIFQTVIKIYHPNYQLEVFSSFEEAQLYLITHHEDIKTLFIDLNMPKFNGIDALRFLRGLEEFKQKNIVIYSTSKNPDDSTLSFANGATDFISKPSQIENLSSAIQKWLN